MANVVDATADSDIDLSDANVDLSNADADLSDTDIEILGNNDDAESEDDLQIIYQVPNGFP